MALKPAMARRKASAHRNGISAAKNEHQHRRIGGNEIRKKK